MTFMWLFKYVFQLPSPYKFKFSWVSTLFSKQSCLFVQTPSPAFVFVTKNSKITIKTILDHWYIVRNLLSVDYLALVISLLCLIKKKHNFPGAQLHWNASFSSILKLKPNENQIHVVYMGRKGINIAVDLIKYFIFIECFLILLQKFWCNSIFIYLTVCVAFVWMSFWIRFIWNIPRITY